MVRRKLIMNRRGRSFGLGNDISLQGSAACSLVLAGITIISGLVLSSSVAFADDSGADSINVTIPAACTLTGTGNSSHTATVSPNSYQADIGTTTLKAICNDANGFAIYAVGYTGEVIEGANSTKLIGASTNQMIPTGIGTSGDSQWAMKLTTDSSATYPITIESAPNTAGGADATFADYHTVPNEYTKVATRLSATDAGAGAIGSTLTTTYAANISSSQTPDIYDGKVKYTLVHPSTSTPQDGPMDCDSGYICYSPRANDIEGTMSRQELASEDTSAVLFASNYSRAGYGFAGWTDSYNYASDPNAHFYGPNETIKFTAGDYTDTNPGLSLYAVWIESAGSLQDTSKVATLCGTGTGSLTTAPIDGTANLSSVSALTDQRDGQTYAIAKLSDGKCWMIENLRLDNTNSDNSTGTLAQGYGTSVTFGNFAGLPNPESPETIYAHNSLYSSDGSNGTINIGTHNTSDRMPRYNNSNTASRDNAPASNGNIYSYGNYYTWAATIADTSEYATNNDSIVNTSICPAGWHVPTGGLAYNSGSTSGVNVTGNPATYRETYNLGYTIMGSNITAYQSNYNSGKSYYGTGTTNIADDIANEAFRRYPNNFVLAGNILGGMIRFRGSSTYYWSSTASSHDKAYSLVISTLTNVYPGTNVGEKSSARPVRCVATLN